MSTQSQMASASGCVEHKDVDLWRLIASEKQRQQSTLELIASENHVSGAVMDAVGSCLTNKYCEGYPAKRYYSGCTYYDEVERLAIDRARRLFGCDFANVQPHSGANANLAVFAALLEPGDTYASVVLNDGGHLTHGSPVNLSGMWFNSVHYPLVYDRSCDDCGYIDYEAADQLCRQHKPKLIMCGYSAYPRTIDFPRFREIADACGAYLMGDIAHIAGLVATGSHPSPFPHCDVVTTTTHKTLRGPRGGLILTENEELGQKINKAVFPGTQGGPLMHVIAGKAACFGEALEPAFGQYILQVVANAKVLADEMIQRGYRLSSGGTDNHLILIDLRGTDPQLTGKDAARWLEQAGIITNKNTVPLEKRSPFVTSGLRMGSPALTTRGFQEPQFRQVADLIDRVVSSRGDEQTIQQVAGEVAKLCHQFPIAH